MPRSAAFPPEGDYVSEINPAAQALVASLAERCDAGVLLIIDYGFPAAEYYHSQRASGTLIAHYRHRAVHDPLFLPGLSDLSAHVDFSAIARAGVAGGMTVGGYATQARFLINCGILDALAGCGDPRRRHICARRRRCRSCSRPPRWASCSRRSRWCAASTASSSASATATRDTASRCRRETVPRSGEAGTQVGRSCVGVRSIAAWAPACAGATPAPRRRAQAARRSACAAASFERASRSAVRRPSSMTGW